MTVLNRRAILIFAALLAVGADYTPFLGAGQELPARNVGGVVTRIDGSKVRGACVSALLVGRSAGNLACVLTDKDGQFTMQLRPGRYMIRAKDESEGYPDPNFLLSADPVAKFPEILVGETDISGVRVILGSKGGVIQGDVRDRQTGLPIAGAKITIYAAREPAAYVEVFSNKEGRFQFTVPAKPISVSATATGYEEGRSDEFVLSGGQHHNVELDLAQR